MPVLNLKKELLSWKCFYFLFLEEEESHTPEEVALNVPERPPTHTTYKMPPLTPTVANLIHTSSVLNKSYSKVGSGSKVMKPGW